MRPPSVEKESTSRLKCEPCSCAQSSVRVPAARGLRVGLWPRAPLVAAAAGAALLSASTTVRQAVASPSVAGIVTSEAQRAAGRFVETLASRIRQSAWSPATRSLEGTPTGWPISLKRSMARAESEAFAKVSRSCRVLFPHEGPEEI